MMPLTPWVRRLLIANAVMFLVTRVVPIVDMRPLVLYPTLILRYPWTLVTYMFLHGGWGHLFFNMLALFFFGPRLESRLGARDFLTLYFVSGMGGALFSFFFAPQYPVIGASGAVYGVLLGFAMFWPREKIYLYMVLPVDAWLLVALAIGASLYMGMTGSGSGTAHFAHLGGLGFAFGYLKWAEWNRGKGRRAFQKAMSPAPRSVLGGDRGALARWKGISVDGMHEINREEIVRLLAKAETAGPQELSQAERDFLDRMSGQGSNQGPR